MAVYRFRIVFEENEDIYREIDILGKQTYEDLHRAIQEAISFDNSKDASFFMSDDLWRKGQEIALRLPDYDDDDDDQPRRGKLPVKQMSKSRVADFIDDPHQRLVYVFDPQAKWTLLLELAKILADDPKATYPRCSKTVGAAPKQYKQKIAPPPEDEEEEDDEEDKKRKEKAAFLAEEGFDKDEHVGDSEEGEDEVATSDEGELADAGEESESEGGDFDPGEFGGGNEDEF